MEYRHEIIEFPDNLPIKIFIHRIGDVNMHWHQSLELLYIVSGTVRVTVGKDVYSLRADDLFLINSNIPHALESEDATMIATQIKPDLLANIPDDLRYHSFECANSADSDDVKFAGLKHSVASLLKLNIEGGKYISLMNTSLCYRLMYELYVHFSRPGLKQSSDRREQLNRLNVLLEYINANYKSELPLEKLASVCYVTVPYLSKIFKNHMGITVSEYIKGIRLHHAANALSASSESVERISENCGFPNTHSFIEAFKAKYGALPSQWRKSNRQSKVLPNAGEKEKTIGYYSSDSSILYSSVSDFIKKYADDSISVSSAPMQTGSEEKISVDLHAAPKTPLRHAARTFIGVSRARELLYEDIRKQLAEAQREIGFRFVKMHSLLDDDMMVYNESGGRPIYNFALVDDVFDFLLSIGLKPFVQISFMPSALASDPNKTTFYSGIITSPPKDLQKWRELIFRFARHLLERYGRKEVRQWPFAVWNEPFTSEKLFGFRTEEEYFRLFAATYESLKAADGQIRVGGPSFFSAYGKADSNLLSFLKWTREKNCPPDFIDIHYYDIDMTSPYVDKNGIKICTPLSPRADSFALFARNLKEMLRGTPYGDIPVYLTEWNSTTSHRDVLSDTCFKSAYIVKNLLETYDMFDANGYWLLSDLHEENLLNNKVFHGGLGMFTYNGIKKPAFFAFRFLAGLGDILLSKGDGYFITEREEGYSLLLYNYHHYSKAYSEDVGINTSYTDRYSVFPEQADREFCFEFPDLTETYRITHLRVNRESGSAFDEFVRAGAVEPMSAEDVRHFCAAVEPKMTSSVETGPVRISALLKPFEIRLITLSPVRGERE